jgi:hypothetical protein
MTDEKFQEECDVLQRFFNLYCSSNHHLNTTEKSIVYRYKDIDYHLQLMLCDECMKLLDYSVMKLQECPHTVKPKCRKCPNPCYAKTEWRLLAKVMRYSGVSLGLVKLKSTLASLIRK